MRSIIKYPGSKWSLAKWIIDFFPEHHSYLEPFFGSGAVFFNKERSHIETINDLDDSVVNLFECIRTDPERLAKEIYFTPYARCVYEKVFQRMPEEPFQKAACFLIRLNMGRGFRTNGEKVGWKNDVQGRERAYAAADWCSLPKRIIESAERLRGVQIENRPAVETIKRFKNHKVLIYCDPPYMLQTRHGKQYRHEMDDSQHEELLETLKEHPGAVIISGYDTPLYNSVLNQWHKEEATSYSQVGSKKKEVLWMNFKPKERNEQLSLF